MGVDTLVNRLNGQIIDQDHINLINRVFQGDFVGRDSSGSPTSAQNLGTPSVPWGTARLTTLILNGSAVDPGLITATPNRVTSGAIRTTSEFPDYLRPAGAGNGPDFTLRATATDLKLDINGDEITYTVDILKTGLTVAPSTNNTCLINDVTLTGQASTKNLGEDGSSITVDAMGSELISKVGTFVALLNQTTNEIMYGLVKSTIKISNIRRGFFFNSSASPIVRAVLNNNDPLQILSLGFIFADIDGATLDISYRNPKISGVTPASPQTGDYWLDLAVSVWKRYSGSSFVQINRTFIGFAAVNTADCIGTRSEYFSKSYSDENTLEINLQDTDVIISDKTDFLISIDGKEKIFDFAFFKWAAGTDFESGVTRTVSTNYYIYITEDGKPTISDKKPYNELGFLKGWYHPFNSWRAVGQIYNNSSDDFEIVDRSDKILENAIGSIISLAYDDGSAPDNYIRTDGSSLDTTAYSALFRRLQYVWGGAGASFTLPDDRGIFHRGLDDGAGIDTGRVFATNQTDAFQRHQHKTSANRISDSDFGGITYPASGNASTNPGFSYDQYLTEGAGGTPRVDAESRPKNETRIFAIRYK